MATRKKAAEAAVVEETVETTAEATAEMAETTEAAEAAAVEHKFSKSQILGSKKFANRKDILKLKLKNDTEYSISEVQQIIENFKVEEFGKGKVDE